MRQDAYSDILPLGEKLLDKLAEDDRFAGACCSGNQDIFLLRDGADDCIQRLPLVWSKLDHLGIPGHLLFLCGLLGLRLRCGSYRRRFVSIAVFGFECRRFVFGIILVRFIDLDLELDHERFSVQFFGIGKIVRIWMFAASGEGL